MEQDRACDNARQQNSRQSISAEKASLSGDSGQKKDQLNISTIPDHDLTIAEVMRVTGISRNRAYALRYYGEYRVGDGQKAVRRIRREEFLYRRNNGLNIAIES